MPGFFVVRRLKNFSGYVAIPIPVPYYGAGQENTNYGNFPVKGGVKTKVCPFMSQQQKNNSF